MVLILGAGGFASEVICNLMDCGFSASEIFLYESIGLQKKKSVFYKGTDISFNVVQELPALGDYKDLKFLIGVGDPTLKRTLVDAAVARGLLPHPTIVHPRAHIQGVRSLGFGGVIAANVIVTCDVNIGSYVILNLGATIGHDSEICDFVTVNPLAAISGRCKIEEGALVGVGSSIKEGVVVGGWSIVGGQAFVSKNIMPTTVVVGVPAKPLN